MRKTQIPIIILNWNSYQDTQECIHSILSNQDVNYHIYLLDNGSNNDDLDNIKKEFLNNLLITISFYKKNLGFANAHNQIFQKLIQNNYSFLFVLNNDTKLPSKTLDIIDKYTISENIGMVTFKMINYWNHKLMDNAGHKMLSSGEIIPIGHKESIQNYNYSFDNIGACAGATLYSVNMLKDIGLFDEYFETGYEDAELGLRAFIAGYRSVYEPQAIVYHKMGQSIKKVFDYDYSLKIQCNIFYTYVKLVHWQVIAINFIPFVLRFIIITFIDIVFWRPKYLKIQYHALYNVFIRDIKRVVLARKASKKIRRISWWKLLLKQEFFLSRDINLFYKLIIKGEKSHFEKY